MKAVGVKEFWADEYHVVSQYVVFGATIISVIWGIYDKWPRVSLLYDVIPAYIIGCGLPLLAMRIVTSRAIIPKSALVNVSHTIVDLLCSFALCIPVLCCKTYDEVCPDGATVYVWLSLLMHVIVFGYFNEKIDRWTSMTGGVVIVPPRLKKLLVAKFIIAIILLYLGGGVMTGDSDFVGNVLHAFTLGY